MRGAAVALLLLLMAGPAASQDQQPLVVDLSEHVVPITTGFAGTRVLMFGATDGPGDIVLVIRGPQTREVVRRKGRVGPIWINTQSVAFADVPSFYHIAIGQARGGFAQPRGLEEIVPDGLRRAHQLGVDALRIEPAEPDGLSPEESALFRKALVELKQSQGLYPQAPGTVNRLGNSLFRTDVYLPSNVPVGDYQVQVYLIRDGAEVSAVTSPLRVSKVGVGAEIYLFANDRATFYGIFAVALAVAVGWLVAVVLRRS